MGVPRGAGTRCEVAVADVERGVTVRLHEAVDPHVAGEPFGGSLRRRLLGLSVHGRSSRSGVVVRTARARSPPTLRRSSDAGAEKGRSGVQIPLMERSDWFLTARERGNSTTAIDRRHGGDAWTSNNLATPLIHGHEYFARLCDELQRTSAGDRVYFTDWRGSPDARLDGPGSELTDILVGLAERGVEVKGLLWRSHPDVTRFSEEENRTLAKAVNEAGGELLLDERVRRAGSHHQKLFVILHPNAPETDVAFVGGIDLCHGRNDGEHHHGDPQAIVIDKRY